MAQSRTYCGTRSLTRVLDALLLCIAASGPLRAQTHKVAAAENVVRAVGVYEWTGDMAKPAASRLIPVSLFIDSKFEDAAVYLARPVPFALTTGNVYNSTRLGLRWERSTWPSRATWWPPRRRQPPTTTAGSATASSFLQLRPSP
ncbi:MAG: hypothetical protein ABSE27_12000, partial [Acidobacteriaceae bacterium]